MTGPGNELASECCLPVVVDGRLRDGRHVHPWIGKTVAEPPRISASPFQRVGPRQATDPSVLVRACHSPVELEGARKRQRVPEISQTRAIAQAKEAFEQLGTGARMGLPARKVGVEERRFKVPTRSQQLEHRHH